MRVLKDCEVDLVSGGEEKPKPKPKPEPCDCETPWYERFTNLPPKDPPDLVVPDPFF